MSLSSTEVLTISAVLVGALVTIWSVLLRREFAKTLGEFKVILRNYQRKKSKDLLTEIKRVVRKRGGKEEALDEISEYTNNWYYLTQAVAKLLEEDKRVHKWAKYVIILFGGTFLMGIYTSGSPQEIFFEPYTRLDILLFLFAIEILVSLKWLWMLISFNRKMSTTISTGELGDVAEVVEEVIEEIKKEEES